MAAGTLAGSLWIQMGMDLARLSDDMAKSKGIISGATKSMNDAIGTVRSALGLLGVGLSVGYFVSFIKGTENAVEHMRELGLEAGTTAEAISRFEAPARSAGLSLDVVAAAMFKMNKASLEAKDPNSKAAQALRAIGVSTEQLKGLKPDEMFELIARSIDKYSDGLGKNNIMQELFGKQGREMNRVVAEIAERGTLAATVTNEQAEAAKKLNDQFLELTMNTEKFWRGIVADVVPTISKMVEELTKGKEIAGGFWAALFAFGTINPFRSVAGNLNVLREELDALNVQREKALSGEFAGLSVSITEAEIAAIKKKIEFLKVMQRQEVEQANYSNEQRRAGVSVAAKKEIMFDPVEDEKRRKLLVEQAKALNDAEEEGHNAEIVAWGVISAKRNEALLLSQKYQDLAQQIIATRASEGEALANSLGTDAEIENKAYADKLERLNAYFATKEDFTVQDQARLEALNAQHQFNLNNQNTMGIKSRGDIERMGGDQQLSYYTGTLMQITAAGAQHNKKLFELNKIAGIANALVSTYQGAAAALKWGWPLGPIFAAIIVAAGIANIAAIRSASFGGSSSPASVGGGGATPVFTPPTVGSTSQQTQPAPTTQIFINGTIIGNEDFVNNTLIPAIQAGVNERDLRLMGPQSRNAQDIRNGAS